MPAGSQDIVAQTEDPGFHFHAPPVQAPDFSKWEKAWGEAEFSAITVRYEFFVNPERSANYEIARAVFDKNPASVKDRPVSRGIHREVFFWNLPRHPNRFFILEYRRTWKKLWLGISSSWREVAKGTQEYRQGMATLMELIALHRELVLKSR